MLEEKIALDKKKQKKQRLLLESWMGLAKLEDISRKK